MEGIPMLLQVPLAVLITAASLLLTAASVLLYRRSQLEQKYATRIQSEDRSADPLAPLDALTPDDGFADRPATHSDSLTVLPVEVMAREGHQGPDQTHRARPDEMPVRHDESPWEFTPGFVPESAADVAALPDEIDTGFDDDLEVGTT